MSSSHREVPDAPVVVAQGPPALEEQSLSYDLLHRKYLTVDRNYETLKQLARKGALT